MPDDTHTTIALSTPRRGFGRLIPGLLALAALLLLAAPASAAQPRRLWDACGTDDAVAGCVLPRGIAADPNPPGHVFVGDQQNKRIVEFTPWGQFVRAFGWDVVASCASPGPCGQANEIQAVTVKATGGQFKLGFGAGGPGVSETADISATAGAGEVETKLNAITNISTGGGSVAVSGGPGDEKGTKPYRVVFNGGPLAHTNVAEMAIVAGTLPLEGGSPSSGAAVETTNPGETGFEICVPADGDTCQAGSNGSGSGQFSSPQGLAIDSAGSVYVVDRPNRRVEKFDSEGHFLLMFGGQVNKTKVGEAAPEAQQNLCPVDPGDVCGVGVQGAGSGQFNAWTVLGAYITIDTKGTPETTDDTLYVGDQNRIQTFDTGGHYEGNLPDPGGVLSGKKVQSLAVDEDPESPAQGDLYLAREGQEGVLKLNSGGEALCTLQAESKAYEGPIPGFSEGEIKPIERPSAVATGPGGLVYVTSAILNGTPPIRMRIVQFDASSSTPCTEVDEIPVEKEEASFNASTGLAANICPGSEAPGNLYATNASTTDAFLRAYGTPPEGCEEPPAKAPEVTAQYAAAVESDGARVHAEINPHFLEPTTFYVEYGSGDCAAGGCDQRSPLGAEATLGGGVTQLPVTSAGVFLNGLEPDTTYHYRFVAKNPKAGPVYGIDPDGEGEGEASFAAGLEATFTTPPLPPGAGTGCANDARRIASSSTFLPDCRAYEMVSPVDKNGFGIETAFVEATPLAHAAIDQSDPGGGAITYSSKQAFGDAIASPYTSQYIARRDPSAGWATHAVNAPHIGFAGSERISLEQEYRAFSADLSEAWLVHEAEPPLDACAPANSPVLYRRSNLSEGYEALHCKPLEPNTTTGTTTIELQSVSADGCRAVFRAKGKLTEDAKENERFQLYESSCEGPLRLVSVLPNGTACNADSSAGSPNGETGGAIGGGRRANVLGALSADAKRLYWMCGNSLYLRSDPDPEAEGEVGEESVLVSPPPRKAHPPSRPPRPMAPGCSSRPTTSKASASPSTPMNPKRPNRNRSSRRGWSPASAAACWGRAKTPAAPTWPRPRC